MRKYFTLTLKLTLDELHLEIQVFENPRMLFPPRREDRN